MSESDLHFRLDVPTLLVGKGNGLYKGNRHQVAPKETPIGNFLVDVAQKFGAEVDDGSQHRPAGGRLADGPLSQDAGCLSMRFTSLLRRGDGRAALGGSGSGRRARRTLVLDGGQERRSRRACGRCSSSAPNVNVAEADGTTALHWAIRAARRRSVATLIRAGANVKAANRYG